MKKKEEEEEKQPTDEQEDEDGDGHHEGGVSIESDGLDDPRLKDLTPPAGANTHIISPGYMQES